MQTRTASAQGVEDPDLTIYSNLSVSYAGLLANEFPRVGRLGPDPDQVNDDNGEMLLYELPPSPLSSEREWNVNPATRSDDEPSLGQANEVL